MKMVLCQCAFECALLGNLIVWILFHKPHIWMDLSQNAFECAMLGCLVRVLNPLSQILHLNGFDQVCVPMCLVRSVDCLNPFPHTSHLNGADPVWVRMCLVRSFDWLKPFPHISNLNGVDPVWVRMCLLRWWECLLRQILLTLYLGPKVFLSYWHRFRVIVKKRQK